MSTPLKLGSTLASRGKKFAPCPQNVVSNSARVAEAERRISHLEEENIRLAQELNDVQSLYRQLTTECTRESFDERRVNLLKSQVIQLERQNLLLIEMTNSHTETVIEVENALVATIDYCQSLVSRSESINKVRVSCTELDQIVTALESARKHLCKMAEKMSSLHRCSKPLLWYGSFLRNRRDHPVTLFDVCRGDIEHINLKHVSSLESKLVNLYKELVLVSNSLQLCIQSSSAGEVISAAPTAVYSRLSDQVQHSCDLLQEVCSQLLQLSLLVPAAPFPALNNPPFEPLTVENVMKVFGKFAKTRDAKQLIEALVKYVDICVNQAGIENQLLLQELEFHRAVYKLETQYVEALFSSVNKCYAEFESDVQEVICQPLGEVLQVFSELQESADNSSLLHFIEVFHNRAPGLLETVEKLSVNVSSQSGKGCQFSEYGTQFLKSMKQCHAECKQKRDVCIAKLDAVKQQLSHQTKELIQIISDKDQHLNGNSVHAHQNIQAQYKSNSEQIQTEKLVEAVHRPSKAECTCLLDDSTSVDKLNDTATLSDDLKTSAVAGPSSVAQIYCSSVLPTTSVSSMRDQPSLCKQIRSKRMVPGIVQRSLILKPIYPNSSCSKTLSRASVTYSHGTNAHISRSTSFIRDVQPLASSLTEQSDVVLNCRSDFSDSVNNVTGRWSAASGRAAPP